MKVDLQNILNEHKIRITKQRISILVDFLNAEKSLDLDYFLRGSNKFIDRSTVFRTLQLFCKKKIIYKVAASDNISRYLLLAENLIQNGVDHSSFICTQCGNVTRLDTIVAPKVKLPSGFRQQKMEIVINGLCRYCRE